MHLSFHCRLKLTRFLPWIPPLLFNQSPQNQQTKEFLQHQSTRYVIVNNCVVQMSYLMVTIIFSPALISAACINLLLNVSCLILQNARNESHSVSSPKAYTPSGLKIVYLIMLSQSNTWILIWNLEISKLIQIVRRFEKSCVKVGFFDLKHWELQETKGLGNQNSSIE